MRRLLPALFVLSATLAHAQLSDKVSLIKQYTNAQMGADSGNSCWGYVSPSGREYGIFGFSNKTIFVDLTNPQAPDKFAEIPHSNGLWSDMKVYKYACYVSTENQGQGIQVIDLRNIDNHQVTLTRTLSSPGRSHTLNVDEVSGFLYCVGARGGTGTTMCFDLTDPLNPVRVGMNSLTGSNYVHECQVVTYTSGPYAGKQIMFAGGVERGFEIWDVTNKNNVTLIKRVVYPFVGYCHQGWLSKDRKYFYVNDEFDESQQGFAVRTLVFDVSVLETADLVATYSNNKPCIDHNIYTKNGFIFHSNYTSGLWIFDGNSNPTSPTLRGYYDTYANGDPRVYEGAWSNYPYLPSGVVLISDITGGAFIVDVSEATKTLRPVAQNVTIQGRVVNGGLSDLEAVDQKYIVYGKSGTSTDSAVQIELEGTSPWADISKMQFSVTGKVNTPGYEQTVELYDWVANEWVTVGSNPEKLTDTTVTVLATSPDRFVEGVSNRMRARLSLRLKGPSLFSDVKASLDHAGWTINP